MVLTRKEPQGLSPVADASSDESSGGREELSRSSDESSTGREELSRSSDESFTGREESGEPSSLCPD
jgi:hypothetical protein